MALEEGSKAARGFIEALKDQPLVLSLCVMNILLVLFLYYTGFVAHEDRRVEMKMLYENRSEMAKLLYACTPPPSGQH